MSLSNRLVVVYPIKRIDSSTFSDKGKGPLTEPITLLIDSNDESSQAFAKMSRVERDKLKQELLKSYPESYIKGLREPHLGMLAIYPNLLPR